MRGGSAVPTLSGVRNLFGKRRFPATRRAARRIQEPVRAGRPVPPALPGEQAGVSPFPGVSDNGPALLGPDRDKEGAPPEWSKPVDGCSIREGIPRAFPPLPKGRIMKTWTETLTLAALAVLFTLAACADDGAVTLDPEIDEEAVAGVQAYLENSIASRTSYASPWSGLPQPPVDPGRRIDPDLDEEKIRKFAVHGEDERSRRWRIIRAQMDFDEWDWPDPPDVRLNEAEIDLLLDRMRAAKAARMEAAK